jgi:ABC-type nitrate/sulfonate/bicarbonate transport system substrate-binding protein
MGAVRDPNYLLSSFSVRLQWAAAHRQEVVRFLKAVLQARQWLEDNRKAGAEFLAKRARSQTQVRQKGLDGYSLIGLGNRIWTSTEMD